MLDGGLGRQSNKVSCSQPGACGCTCGAEAPGMTGTCASLPGVASPSLAYLPPCGQRSPLGSAVTDGCIWGHDSMRISANLPMGRRLERTEDTESSTSRQRPGSATSLCRRAEVVGERVLEPALPNPADLEPWAGPRSPAVADSAASSDARARREKESGAPDSDTGSVPLSHELINAPGGSDSHGAGMSVGWESHGVVDR